MTVLGQRQMGLHDNHSVLILAARVGKDIDGDPSTTGGVLNRLYKRRGETSEVGTVLELTDVAVKYQVPVVALGARAPSRNFSDYPHVSPLRRVGLPSPVHREFPTDVRVGPEESDGVPGPTVRGCSGGQESPWPRLPVSISSLEEGVRGWSLQSSLYPGLSMKATVPSECGDAQVFGNKIVANTVRWSEEILTTNAIHEERSRRPLGSLGRQS